MTITTPDAAFDAVRDTLAAMRAVLTVEHDQEVARAAVVADRIGLRRAVATEIVALDIAVERCRAKARWVNDEEHRAVLNLIDAAEKLIKAWRASWDA